MPVSIELPLFPIEDAPAEPLSELRGLFTPPGPTPPGPTPPGPALPATDQSPPAPAGSAGEQAATEHGALYRTYRSLTFGEVAGQLAVTQGLRNAVRYSTVRHAYLFTGPRGTGKTSTARILARAVNCLDPRDGEPCNRCTICVGMLERRSLDLVEIDGASNNSVDDVRELIGRVNFRPAEARRKVFIIDEVHMLSIGAFNALLKTLEEPPEHVLFLLATTEIQKVPATITSRCQVFHLKPIAPLEMRERLRYICDSEEIVADEAVLNFLIGQSTGSLRDALSLLEQIRAYCGDVLDLQEVEAALGLARAGQVARVSEWIAMGDLAGALLALGELFDNGLDPRQLTRQLLAYWREALVGRARRQPVPEPRVAALQADAIAGVMRSLLAVEGASRRSDSSRLALELAVAEATLALGKGITPEDRPAPRIDHGRATGTDAGAAVPIRQADPAHGRLQHAGNSEPAASAPPTEAARPEGVPHSALAEARLGDAGQGTRSDGYQACVVEAAAAPERPADANGSLAVDGTDEQGAGIPTPGLEGATPGAAEVRERWPLVLRWLEEHRKPLIRNTLNATTGDGIHLEGTELIIGFPPTAGFMRTQLENPRNRSILEEAVRAVYGSQWTVRCATIEGLSLPRSAEELEQDAGFFERAWRADGLGPNQSDHGQ